MDIVVFLSFGVVGYLTVSDQCQLTHLGQILVFTNQLVEFFLTGIAIALSSDDTGRTTVAHLFIIVIERIEVITQLEANDVQQVIVEDAGINPMDDEWSVALVLHLGQPSAEFLCQLRPFYLQPQTIIVRTHTVEHCLPDRPQHLVSRALALLFHLLHGRLQRVRSNRGHCLGTQQRGLQQLTVVTTFLGLCHNLLQQFVLGLGQILVLRLFHFLPEGSIRLSKQHHRHNHHYEAYKDFLHHQIFL